MYTLRIKWDSSKKNILYVCEAYPNCETVLNAMILFKSFCSNPEAAANIEVTAPTQVITHKAVGLYSRIGLDLTSK